MNRIPATLTRALTFVTVLALTLAMTSSAGAQQVFSSDPTDPVSGRPYPILPGLPLLLPGADGDFGTLDDVINTGITGDVDLAVRVGTIVGSSVPAPAGAVGGPTIATVVAGGGSTGTGGEIDVTVLVSDGSGSPPYGGVITNADLDSRPLVIYAFPDLDGDGAVGPTDFDGSIDNALERQEATAYVGRQVGSLSAGRHFGSLGIHVAAPASMGGLRVVLSAGVYTGTDSGAQYSDGTPVFTLWPYLPPLDPKSVVGNGTSPAPDPNVPSEIEFSPEKNYLPTPGTPLVGMPFAMPTDGSEPSTDQFVAISGPVHAAAFFEEVDPSFFRSVSRVWLRPAPNMAGGARVLVLAANELELLADGAATQRNLRLLPVDLLGNIADPDSGGFAVELIASPGVRIVAPDTDSDTASETLVLSTAAGVTITLDDAGATGSASVGILSGSRILGTLPVTIGTPAADWDEDGVSEDGNGSQLAGDLPCSAGDVTALLPCDDNCSGIVNPNQFDDNENGLGDCCDGVCVDDPSVPGCDECAVAGNPTPANNGFSKLRLILRQVAGKPDKLNIRGRFELGTAAAIDPANEDAALVILQSDVLRYDALLSSAFEQSGGSFRYRYRDPDATVAGTKKALIASSSSNGVTFKLGWRATGVGLIFLTEGAVTVDLALGDDAFSDERACVQKRKRLVCD